MEEGTYTATSRNRRLLLWAILVIVFLALVTVWFTSEKVSWRRNKALARRVLCLSNLHQISLAMWTYANDHDGELPRADRWCDLLIEQTETDPNNLVCRNSGATMGQSSYAMNENVAGRRISDLASDLVLLFETKPGWNQVGGPDILISDIHKRKGCNVAFVNGDVKFVKVEDLEDLKWELWDYRRAKDDADLRYWLENMVWYHRFSNDEIIGATGLAKTMIEMAKLRFDIRQDNRPRRAEDAPLLVLPYPGGRHPRIGFLEGAIDPQRETKFSVFTPWDANSYVVVDVPEAIWSNLGLTYLAHTHIDTIWAKQEIELEKLEWNRRPDGGLDIRRKLPNGIEFAVAVTPTRDAVLMEMRLANGTDKKLNDLRIQNCVMTKMAKGFQQQTNENKMLKDPYAACRSGDGKRWIITAWQGCHRTWANEKCPCFHSDPKFPDLEPGQEATLKGWLSFYEGMGIEAEFARIKGAGWREK